MAPSLIVISGEVNCLTAVPDVSRATRDATLRATKIYQDVPSTNSS
jgi:hypothetical protein